MDGLIDRLRGKYKIGPNGECGIRDFSAALPSISFEAADRIEKLEQALTRLADSDNWRNGKWVGDDEPWLIAQEALKDE